MKKELYIKLGLITGVILLINVVSSRYFFRWDWTANKQYTLSEATVNCLEDLEDPVTIKAYFSTNLPTDVAKTKQSFNDLLIEYSHLANGNIAFEFIDPSEKEEIEQEALQSGIMPIMINVREKDQMKQQKAFLGAIVEFDDQVEVIPFMKPGEAMEYAMTSAIRKLTIDNKPYIGIVSSHGCASKYMLEQSLNSLEILYKVEDVDINDSTEIDSKYKSITIIAPQDTFSANELAKLSNYQRNGGHVLVAINTVEGNLQQAYGSIKYTALEDWLHNQGIDVDAQFLVDATCGNVTVQQQQGFFRMESQVSFPYLPVIKTFADHPVSKGLELVIMNYASPIHYDVDSSVNVVPLAFSSQKSGSVSAPTYFQVQKQWLESDFPLKNQPVAVAFENMHNTSSKLVVIGDGDFAVNKKSLEAQSQRVHENNVNLLVNSIDWLSDDTGLIELRTKSVKSRPIDELEDGTKTLLKYLNLLSPILLLVIYGLVRWQMKRNLRIKRMELNYE